MSKSKSPSLMVVAGGTTAIAVASFLALNYGLSAKKEEKKAETTDVFAQDISSAPVSSTNAGGLAVAVTEAGVSTPPAEATDPAAVTTDPAAVPATADASAVATTDPATDPATPATDPAPVESTPPAEVASSGGSNMTAEEAKQIGEEAGRRVAEQIARQIVEEQMKAAPAASTATASSDGGGMTEADARRIGEAEGRRIAERVAAKVARRIVQREMAKLAAASGGSEVAESKPAKASKPAAEPASEPTPEAPPATEVAAAEPASEPAAKPEKPSKSSKKTKGAGVANAPAADALTAWWPRSVPNDQFNLVYAGQPKGETSIALLFNSPVGADALSSGVRVVGLNGEKISGTWQASSNPRLMLLKDVKPGRYTVIVSSDIKNAQGKAISQPLQGPVYIR
jgi:hypothetical protein